MSLQNLSVQTKIVSGLVLVFLTLMVATTWHMALSERAMAQSLAEQKAMDTANSFFDGINTMMLTGTMGQRDVLRQKVLSNSDVIETRIIRSSGITGLFGTGNPEQSAQDAFDRSALSGEQIIHSGKDETGRFVTVVNPIVATSDFRGTNCLTCHTVEEGTVLGATRVTYSLASLDKQIDRNILISGAINIAMLVFAILVITWLLRHFVTKPLTDMRDRMAAIEAEADLSLRLDARSGDEIGNVASAFNSMLARFSNSLHEVFATTEQLKAVAGQIAEVSSQTTSAAEQQRAETDAVATAVTELESTAIQVRESANSAANASIEADRIATDGATTTREAIDGIHRLVSEIERAADVIESLDDRSKTVGSVLDVIKSIAEQTNLLALNAAIEAARAGKSGRGFSVVADEVRTLANRSHESTQEIESIVKQLQDGARDAVEVMTLAKESAKQGRVQVETADTGLNRIAENVAHIRELNVQMSVAATEQSVVTEDVSRSVVKISQLSDRTTTDAEQTTAVSQSLLALSDKLESLVNKFRF